ncbi:hypothetical protein D3C87_1530840 [compost metagenome]
MGGHDLIDRDAVDVDAAVQGAAQITVGKNPGQFAIGFEDHRHAQALAGHFHQRILEQGAALDLRQLLPGVHDVFHFQQQAAAEGAARVRKREIFSGKATGLEQRDGQGIAHDQCSGGR